MKGDIVMSTTEDLTKRILKIVESIQSKDKDPLDFRLSEAYQELRTITADVDSRIDIDVMLNEILGAKVSRIQELARVLAAPELYVSRIEGMNLRDLGKLMCYRHPVRLSRLGHQELTQSMERMTQLHEAMTKEKPEDLIPKMSGVPDDFIFESEDSIYLEDLEKFALEIPMNEPIQIETLVMDEDFDVFLKHFLFVVVLVSRGILTYDNETRVVTKVENSY